MTRLEAPADGSAFINDNSDIFSVEMASTGKKTELCGTHLSVIASPVFLNHQSAIFK